MGFSLILLDCQDYWKWAIRKLIFQTRMRSHPVRLDVWFLVKLFVAWAFAGRLCDKYHNLMSWLKWAAATRRHPKQQPNVGTEPLCLTAFKILNCLIYFSYTEIS